MKSVMRYVSQLSKTLWDGQPLVSGIGCQPETAFDEFLSTKLLHRKDGGVMFYHMVQSFPKGADIDPRTAHEAARRLAEYFEGCEVLVCTHVDREHIHSHCIINSVNFETGKKVHMADEQIQELRIRNDQICEELGLPKFQRDEQRHSRGMSNAEYYTADRGESWKFELMRVIDDCMRCAGNREEFLILLRSEGYDATWTDSRKNITYTTPDGRKCRDSKLHIEKYLKENMEAEFGYRTENDNTRNVDAAQKADGRGAAAGTQRDGHGAELERAARNAGQAVPAADAVGHRSENAPDEAGSTGSPDRDADERRKFRETGWEPEREVFFRLQGADRDYEERPDHNPERYEESAFGYGADGTEEDHHLRVDLDCGSDLVHGAVRLGRAVEQMTDDAPTRDGTTIALHIDSKRRKKLRQKKTALGHAEDDHEDWDMEQKM
ncbi:MAG: relaxase/mobilization nuclease domain-containing protein [Oscillospiraceae bacterium]